MDRGLILHTHRCRYICMACLQALDVVYQCEWSPMPVLQTVFTQPHRNANNDVNMDILQRVSTHLQLDIIRILLLVPVYAIISLLSYFFWVRSMLVAPLLRTERYVDSCHPLALGPRLLRIDRLDCLLLSPTLLSFPSYRPTASHFPEERTIP